MKTKSYITNHRKKSFASLILAFLLMFTFNASPIMLIAENFKTANAYKSTQSQTYYSSSSSEAEKKFNDAQYPSSLAEFFDGSNKNYNIYTYYNEKFEEIYAGYVNTFFASYAGNVTIGSGETSQTVTYNSVYTTFLNSFTLTNKTLYGFYTDEKDGKLKELMKTEDFTFYDVVELFATKGIENYDDNGNSLPALSTNLHGVYVRLSDVYRQIADHALSVSSPTPEDTEDDSNWQIASSEAFYNGNTHYLRLKNHIDSEISKLFPAYAYDGKTQDTNILAIFSKLAPTTVAYNYVSNTYEKYTVPSASYTSKDKINVVYYFGAESDISSKQIYTGSGNTTKTYEEVKSNFTVKEANDKKSVSILEYRPVQRGEFGYIEGVTTYYHYSTVPYISSSSHYIIYVLNDNPTQSELDTYSSIYFTQITSTDLSEDAGYYVHVPYEADELYFSAIYSSQLFSQKGFTYAQFLDYFAPKSSLGARTSKLYFKISSSTERKYVYIAENKIDEFKTANPNYLYELKTLPTGFDADSNNDYEVIIKNSSNSAYFVDGYELYFEKTKEYYTNGSTNYYKDSYESTFEAVIDLEKQEIASAGYELNSDVSTDRKIYVLSEDKTTIELNSITYSCINQAEIDANPNYYVKVPASMYPENVTSENVLYFKHTSMEAKKLYIVDNSDNASENAVYKTLNYNVISSTELENNYTNYLAVSESDVNYNKNFQLFYKYNRHAIDRTVDVNADIYILTSDIPDGADTGTYKTVKSGELTDYSLIDESVESNKAYYETVRQLIFGSTDSSLELHLYFKLSEVFVQNELKGGNAIYIIDGSLSSSDKEEYSANLYTAIAQSEVTNNPNLYVLINEKDPNYSSLDDVKLYYKYIQSSVAKKTVYSIDSIDTTASDFDKNAYELITSGDDFVSGMELYYKKELDRTESTNASKNTFYYHQTSSTVSLSANSYYAISFYVQTIGDDARATFAIKDTAGLIDNISLSNIKTNGEWQQYYMFIATSTSGASTVNLFLYLGDEEHGIAGNTGKTKITASVFFDDIKITKIGVSDFNKYAIDDKPLYSESTQKKEGEGESATLVPNHYVDEYDNRVYVVNLENSMFTDDNNKYNYRNYIDSTINTYGSGWNSMFSFDNASSDLKTLLGYNDSSDEENTPINNTLSSTINTETDGYDMYTSDFNTLWKYYISRDLSNEFSIAKYRQAYLDGKLDVSITNEIEQPKTEEDDDDDDDDDEDVSDIVYVSSPFSKNNFALKLTNKHKDISLGITSNSFTIEQFGYYKISLWIYSPDLDGTATISVNSVISDRNASTHGTLLSSTISSTYANVEKSSSSNSEYGWIPVSLYIEGNNFRDMDCYLVLSADSDCTVYFDNIRIEKATSSEYDSASSSSSSDKYITALSLTNSSSLVSTDVKNGTFDYVKETDIEHNVNSSEPYAPDTWTVLSSSSSRVTAGIVSMNSQQSFFNTYSNGSKPTESIDDFSNIFAIYAPQTVESLDGSNVSYKHTYSIYSGSLSLSASTLYKISFKFYKGTDKNGNEFEGQLMSNIYLSSVKTENIVTKLIVDSSDIENGWQTFTYYILTGTSSQTAYLEIGVENATGLCYFKNVASEKISDKTISSIFADVAKENGVNADSVDLDNIKDDVYQSIKNTRFLDMSNNSFDYHTYEKDEETNIYNQNNFTDKSTTTTDYTAGNHGVVVASYFSTRNTTTYSVTIDKVTYYIGEVYETTIDEVTYYIKKHYDTITNKFSYKLYDSSYCSTEISKVGDEDAVIETTGGVIKLKVGETTHETTTTYHLYTYADLTEEIFILSGSKVKVESLDKVVVGTGTSATDYTSTSTSNATYTYNYETNTKTEYVVNGVIIPTSELKNNQSSSVLILANSHKTDYVTLTHTKTTSVGKSSYKVLRVYVKTSDFDNDNYGLNIKIDAINTSWTNINTTNSTKADENGFVCYEVLIKTNSTDSISDFAVTLSIGSETNTGCGYAIISKISLDSFSSEDELIHYQSTIDSNDETVKTAFYDESADSDDSETEDDADDKNSISWATFFYIFASLLLVITMVIAMVALILKKHPIKKSKQFENEHERDIIATTAKNSKASVEANKEVVADEETDTSSKKKTPRNKDTNGGII